MNISEKNITDLDEDFITDSLIIREDNGEIDGPTIDYSAPFSVRISQKNIVEPIDLERINRVMPYPLVKSKKEEDLKGIDAFFLFPLKDGLNKTVKISIKKRVRKGDDPLIEAVRPWNVVNSVDKIVWNQRDVLNDANYFFFIDRKLKLRIMEASYVKEELVKPMVREFVKHYIERDEEIKNGAVGKNKLERITLEHGQVWVQLDESPSASYKHGKIEKLLVYLNPKTVKIFKEYQLTP